jgi:FkbM family methyltransferase
VSIVGEDLIRWLRLQLDSDLVVVDVGARWGVADRWRPFGPRIKVIGFDPDEEECARLEKAEGADGRVSFVPAALGPRPGPVELHVTAEPACSSVYAPIPSLIRHRPDLACTEAAGTTMVDMTTLDEWYETSGHDHVDVVKLDTQGSELGVLEGGTETLESVLMLEIEVEFNPIYEAQPLFGDVDRFLRDRGFVLWRIQQLVHYGLDDVSSADAAVPDIHYYDSRPVPLAGQGGQLFWAHAYFVQADLAMPGSSPLAWSKALRAACAAAAFGFVDLAVSLLERADDVPPGRRDDLTRLRRST